MNWTREDPAEIGWTGLLLGEDEPYPRWVWIERSPTGELWACSHDEEYGAQALTFTVWGESRLWFGPIALPDQP